MTLPRLSRLNAHTLPPDVQRPAASTGRANARIVHLGIGAFHRAHQAVYTQAARPTSDHSWQIVGASLRSGAVRDQLAAQDYLYTVVTRDGAGEQLALVDVIDQVLVGPEDPAAVIDAIADSSTRIVSLTVTEKGYCSLPDSGHLNLLHPDIRHDLENPGTPCSAPGYIVAALQRRWQQGDAGITVLSCDNLPDNGHLCRTVVLEFARQLNPELARWIDNNTRFPATMVDRIVPATTGADRDSLARRLGVEDRGMVVCEPFCQWVIEDDFGTDRPAWEDAGALLVTDIAPYEQMKLRLLNGSHSAMAYLGMLAGYRYMHEVIADPSLATYVQRLMDEETGPTLKLPDNFDLAAYKQQLLQRFANPALQHRTLQVAMDGSQKLPQRLLPAARYQLQAAGPIDAICIAVAAWMQYACTAKELDDPMAEDIRARCGGSKRAASDLAHDLLNMTSVFGADLPREQRFVDGVCHWLTALRENGVGLTLDMYLSR